MNNNYQNMDPNTNLNDYLNGTQGQVNNQPVVNQNVNNQPSVNPNVNMGMNNVSNVNGMPMNQPPKKNNSMMILIIVVAVLLVGVGGFVVFKAFSNDGETGSGSTGASSVVAQAVIIAKIPNTAKSFFIVINPCCYIFVIVKYYLLFNM